MPDGEIASGGFFFLSPVKIPDNDAAPATSNMGPGPSSSLPGRPDVKLFFAASDYPIQGVDFSKRQGVVRSSDWTPESVRFVYIRSNHWNGSDNTFLKSWEAASNAGLDRGAYAVFDYCLPPQAQIANVESRVSKDPTALPFSLGFEDPRSSNQRQADCAHNRSTERIKNDLLVVLEGIKEYYGKTPLIYGTSAQLGMLDSRFSTYMIWLALRRHDASKANLDDLRLAGSNPWTLWNYSNAVFVDGLGKDLSGSVFFGNEHQYRMFKLGKSNVALDVTKRQSTQ